MDFDRLIRRAGRPRRELRASGPSASQDALSAANPHPLEAAAHPGAQQAGDIKRALPAGPSWIDLPPV